MSAFHVTVIADRPEYKGEYMVLNPDRHKDLIREIRISNPDILITTDLLGFDRSTLTDNVAYNLLNCKQIHLLLHEHLPNERYLTNPLSIAMFFYCIEPHFAYYQNTYSNLPFLKRIPIRQGDEEYDILKDPVMMQKILKEVETACGMLR